MSDWIKMHSSLCTNPKVLLMAEIIGQSLEAATRLLKCVTPVTDVTQNHHALQHCVTRDVTRDIVIGCLLRVWSATNQHTDDGVWKKSSLRTIDAVAGVDGFGKAMEEVEWLVYDSVTQTVTLPNFLENNAPNKGGSRSRAAQRQAKYRENLKKKAELERSNSGQYNSENDNINTSQLAETSQFSDVTRDVTSDATLRPREREDKRRISTNVDIKKRERDDTPDAPNLATVVCVAMRHNKIANVNPSHPNLIKLILDGATSQSFSDATQIAVGKGKMTFDYILGIVKNSITEQSQKLNTVNKNEINSGGGQPKLQSFKDRDRQLVWEKWEALHNDIHPDRPNYDELMAQKQAAQANPKAESITTT